MTDWEFHAGEPKTATVTMINPKQLATYYDALLYMGTDLAVMSQQSFHLDGLEEKIVPFPVTMPAVAGLYPVHLGIFTAGHLLKLYQADDVKIKEPRLGRINLYQAGMPDYPVLPDCPYYEPDFHGQSSCVWSVTWLNAEGEWSPNSRVYNVHGQLTFDRRMYEASYPRDWLNLDNIRIKIYQYCWCGDIGSKYFPPSGEEPDYFGPLELEDGEIENEKEYIFNVATKKLTKKVV